MDVKITKDNVAKVLKAVSSLTKREVLVGIPQTTDAREGSPFGNAAIGYLNEFGSPVNNIPPRPHLVPGVEKAAPDAAKQLQAAGHAVLGGDMKQADAGLVGAGLICQSSVRGVIASVLSPPLAPSTLYARKHRKKAPREGETPLIDTGAYNQAITFVVREK